ncbi:MAG TPA: phage holin family protein [Chitinophagaceae bacterium]|nr:phage holin family protein [Chitinophagaceae bacterium]
MEKIFAKTEQIAEEIKELVNVKLDSAKLTVAEKSSKVASNIISAIIAAVAVILFIIFFSVALAYLLADALNNTWAGFLIVSGIYLLGAILIRLIKERVIRIPIMNSILSQLSKKDKDDEED